MAGRGGWMARKWLWEAAGRGGSWEANWRALMINNGRNHGRLRLSTLAYDEITIPGKASEGMRTVMFVHGLLGSGRNWRTFAKRLANTALEQSLPNSPGYRMILVDLRNHGNSASLKGFAPPHDMPAAARDILELVKASAWGWPEIIISHSMGGKVALEFSQKAASGNYGDVVSPKQLWVLDSVPGEVPDQDSKGEVEQVLSTIQSLPDPLPSRRWLVDHMTALGFSKALSDWLASNLKRANTSSEEMTWIFNPKEAQEMFHSYRKSDYWSILEDPPKRMEIGIVRASRSDRWTADVVTRLERLSDSGIEKSATGKVSYHVLENAGHWLHVDNPEGLAKILCPYLVKTYS